MNVMLDARMVAARVHRLRAFTYTCAFRTYGMTVLVIADVRGKVDATRRRLRGGGLFQAVFAQADVELGARQAEPLGGLRLVPAALPEDLRNRVAFDRGQIGSRRVRPARRTVQRQMLRTD